MSKSDVIEIEGTVVEKLPNTMFQVERAQGACAYQRQAAPELHPHPSRGQGDAGTVSLRPDQGAHHLER